MKFTIQNEELQDLNEGKSPDFPKYTSQLINWANQNAQGTRPRMVGQLSDLFPEYQKETDSVSLSDWKEWYLSRYPQAITSATDKIFEQIENLKNAIKLIDKDMVHQWVEDLVITKTYNGLYVQKAILSKIAELQGTTFCLAGPDEEALGIDGYVGGVAYSVKPESYKTMDRLSETIHAKMVYYAKKKTGLTVEVEE